MQRQDSITIYTIGFSQKNAQCFFGLLQNNHLKTLVDVRLNNVSQLAGFTKKDDLRFFLSEICNIKYIHRPEYAPSKDILDSYKSKEISWNQYEKKYLELLTKRDIIANLNWEELNDSCFLCSEPTAEHCHRRLLAEHLKNFNRNIIINHL